MFRNMYYLVLGMVLGVVLGLLVCDDTKKRIIKALHNKVNRFSGCVKSSSETAEKAIHAVKNAVQGLT